MAFRSVHAIFAFIFVLVSLDALLAQSPVRPLANDYVVITRSPSPKDIYCYTPGLARLTGGRLVATMDFGGKGMNRLRKELGTDHPDAQRGRVFTSDDHGKTWTYRTSFPFCHARPFVAGKSLYVLGHSGRLRIIRSDDNGETWSKPADLTKDGRWHQSACNVWHKGDNVYLVMENTLNRGIKHWPVGQLAPVLMRANINDDLTKPESWTFADQKPFVDLIKSEELDNFGVPFFKVDPKKGASIGGRGCAPIGWLEANVVQFTDPDHYWYDPAGKTFHIFLRSHTGGTGYASLCKVKENEDGTMTMMLETVPSGRKVAFLPMPGGQMRFHILYDEQTKLYWLLSSQATDSMTRAERLPKNRYNLPNNERHRLQLHFSKNCVDWCFAGLVAVGDSAGQGRHYASMVIDGDDLQIASRSGDADAKDAHNGNIITFHTIKDFRDLAY
jgi:hypothetical protein